jgi:prepilin-type processing-associated H-X9-DG protein
MDNILLLPGTNDRVFTVFDAVMPYMKNVDIIVCPSNRPGIDWEAILATIRLRTAGNFRYGSYAYNFALFQDPSLPPGLWENDPVVPMAAVQDPVNTIMFYDSVYKHPMDPLIDPNCPRPRFIFDWSTFPGDPRHKNGININFVDGHARVAPPLQQDSWQVVLKNTREVGHLHAAVRPVGRAWRGGEYLAAGLAP